MKKHCFLVGRKDSLFKQLVASLLVDVTDTLELHENKAVDFSDLLDEIKEVMPDMILLEETSPFAESSLLVRVLVNIPDLPVIVISDDTNLIYMVRRETRLLSSSKDLIKALEQISVQPELPNQLGDSTYGRMPE